MAAVLRKGWTRQPPAAARIARHNPITRGLVFAALPVAGHFFDCVSQAFGTNVGTISGGIRGRNDGGLSREDGVRVLTAAAAVGNYVEWPISTTLRGATMAAEATILGLVSTESQVDGFIYPVASNAEDALNGDGYSLGIDSFFLQDRGNLLKYNSSINNSNLASSSGAFVGNPFDRRLHLCGFAASGSGNVGDFFAGDKVAAYTGGSNGSLTTNRQARIFADQDETGANLRRDMSIGLVLFWDRRISRTEYASLLANPWQVFARESRLFFLGEEAGGAVGLASETDTALALAARQITVAGRADETDVALALSAVSIRATGLASQIDTALALSGVQIRATGRADETDSAIARAAVQILLAGRADETDAALALAVGGSVGARADETDTALARSGVQLRAVGLASETDTALARSAVAIRATGLAMEADSALALAPVSLRAVGVASETDAALARSAVQIRAVGLASETSTALALAATSIRGAGLASESDAAFALAAVQKLLAGLALESDVALAPGAPRALSIQPESRVYLIVPENRERASHAESRRLHVEPQTRVFAL